MVNISRHLVTTRATRNDMENDKCIQISAMSTRVSGKYRGISSESSNEAGDLQEWGLSGRNSYENLELELAKSFNPNRREIRVPAYRWGVKDPNTTQWRRGPVSRTAKLVKSFAMSRLNFGQGVWKGDSYRQSALIPTCDAPYSIVH